MWGEALREVNPEAWEQLKKEMFGKKDVLDYVQKLYPELKGNELAEEVFTHFAGRRGAERLRSEQERLLKENGTDTLKQSRIIAMFNDLRNMLSAFWQKARDLFAGKVDGIEKMTGEEFANMMLPDLMGGFNLNEAKADAAEKAEGRIKEQRGADEDVRFRTKEAAGRTMHSVGVTPEMEESVMKGQVMFCLEDGETEYSAMSEPDLDKETIKVH